MTAAMGTPAVLSQKRSSSLPRLEPFPHQVAGQSLMLRYDQNTMCKSLTPREHSFYQVVPAILTQFVPQYRGVVHLYLPEPDNGDCTPRPPCHQEQGAHNLLAAGLDKKRRRSLQKTCRTRLDRGGHLYFFLLLEDIISPFRCPCVLDLKMGTRQHGDDASADKVAYQVNKCQSTTSAALGLRLCGMKRYMVTTGQYDIKDKHCGRQLLEEEVKSMVASFFFNGRDYRLNLVAAIVSRLQQLQSVIQSLDGYRFYSSSLLIVYEGAVDVPDVTREAVVADKAQPCSCSVNASSSKFCPSSSFSSSPVHDGFDLNVSLSDLEACPSHKSPDPMRGCDRHQRQTACVDCVLSERVDIRIVDFAHSTFQGFCSDTVVHSGPDQGFLLGIRTLIDVFTDLNNKQRHTDRR